MPFYPIPWIWVMVKTVQVVVPLSSCPIFDTMTCSPRVWGSLWGFATAFDEVQRLLRLVPVLSFHGAVVLAMTVVLMCPFNPPVQS